MNKFSYRPFLFVRLCIVAVILISISTMISFIIGEWRLLSFESNYIPMATLTAILFLAISYSLFLQLKDEGRDLDFSI